MMRELIRNNHLQNITLCDDFNSRISHEQQFLSEIYFPMYNALLDRKSMDSVMNKNGKIYIRISLRY